MMVNSKEYFLYLESFVFLFFKGNRGLLYDSSRGKSYRFDVGGELQNVITGLSQLENMYVVRVADEILSDKYVQAFIDMIRKFYLGDVISTSICPVKPVLFPPVLDFQESKLKEENSTGNKILKNLNDLSIYLTGRCENDKCSQKCSLFCRQLLFCKKSDDNEYVDINVLKRYLDCLPNADFRIHLIGGDLETYPYWNEVLDFFSTYGLVDYVVHYTSYMQNIDKLGQLRCKILVDYPISKDSLNSVYAFIQEHDCEVDFLFLVKDVDTFQDAVSYQEKYPALKINIKPVYDNNWSFFNENVCFSLEDLHTVVLSKKEIFANQTVNTECFGKLVIDSSGRIYTNLNEMPIGEISSENLKESILKALKPDSSWFRIRNMKPCADCVYQWICPSPSNYEYVIGKSDLCHLKEE